MRKWFWDAVIGYLSGTIAFTLLVLLVKTLIGKPFELMAGVLFTAIVSIVVWYINYATSSKEDDFKELNIKLSEKLDKAIFDEHLKMDSEIIKSIKEMLEDLKKQSSINEERIFDLWQHSNTKINPKNR